MSEWTVLGKKRAGSSYLHVWGIGISYLIFDEMIGKTEENIYGVHGNTTAYALGGSGNVWCSLEQHEMKLS